jgi:WD40 repeat protein
MKTRVIAGAMALLVSSAAFGQPLPPGAIAWMKSSNEVTPFRGYLCAALSPDGRTVALCDEAGRLELRDISAALPPPATHAARLPEKPGVLLESGLKGNAPRWSSDNRWLYHGDPEGVAVWDVAGRKIQHVFQSKTPVDRCPDLALSKDGRTLVAAWPGMTVCWDVATGNERWRHHGTCNVVISPAHDMVYLTRAGIRVDVVDPFQGKLRAEFNLKDNDRIPFCSDRCAINHDGQTLAVWNDRGVVRLIDTKTGLERRRIETGQDFGIALSFSPDGAWLATGGPKNAVKVWEVDTGLELLSREAHQRFVMQVDWSSDGRKVLSCSGDLTAILWDLVPHDPSLAKETRPMEPQIGLRSTFGAHVYSALCAVASDPARVEELGRQIAPVRHNQPERIERLIADLDARRHPVRERAMKELSEQGRLAVPALRAALQTTESAEVAHRAQRLIRSLPGDYTEEELLYRRAVKAMSLAGTPKARQVLETWATGAPGAVLTQDARASLARWK